MNKAVDLMVQMEENLKAEKEVLYERANRLRRQSADAFKLMDDVKKLQGQAIFWYLFYTLFQINQNYSDAIGLNYVFWHLN